MSNLNILKNFNNSSNFELTWKNFILYLTFNVVSILFLFAPNYINSESWWYLILSSTEIYETIITLLLLIYTWDRLQSSYNERPILTEFRDILIKLWQSSKINISNNIISVLSQIRKFRNFVRSSLVTRKMS